MGIRWRWRSILAILQAPLHPSWLCMWLAVGVLAGVGLSVVAESFLHTGQAIVAAGALVAVTWRKSRKWTVLLMVMAGLLVGWARGGATQAELALYEPYYGASVHVSGTVAEDTSMGPRGDQRVYIHTVHIGDAHLAGKVWISTGAAADIKRGDRVTFSGQLQEGFGNVPASMFRAQLVHAERPLHGDVPREVRDWFAAKIRRAIAEPEASLGIGYLVGQRSTLPEDLDQNLRLLGLTHVVVASGYNLTILVRFARRSLAAKSKYAAAAAATAMIISFMLVTGFSPSMSRAGLVAGVSLLAWYVGRNVQPMVLLLLATAATALLNPAFVWGDIGWYLSFLSFAGVMLLAPLLKHYFWGKDAQLGTVPSIVLETMSAQLATLPLIAFVFGQYSPLALPANVLVLPLVPLAMLLTFAAGVGVVLWAPAAAVVGWPAEFVLRYMTGVVDWLSRVPWAHGEVSVSFVGLLAGYGALIGTGYVLWRRTRHNYGKDNIVL